MSDRDEVASPPTAVASAIVVGVCLAMAGLGALEARHISVTHGVPLDWSLVFASTTPRWLVLAVALPFVLTLGIRVTPSMARRPVWALHLILLAALTVVVAMVDAWSVGLASPVAHFFAPMARFLRSWYATLPIVVLAYAAVVGAAWGITETRERQRRSVRASQLEAQLQASRLAALRAQVQPHFLYNTLNGIAALVADVQPARAVAAIEQLAELLHVSLRDDGRDSVSIDEEVALSERYLALQAMRFGERLRYNLAVAAEVGQSQVPALLLQPIIENAVLHGLEAGVDVLHVEVRVTAMNGTVTLTVTNNGPETGPAPGRSGGHGLGLATTRARLATAYGEAASLSLLPREGGGTTVKIVLPRIPAEGAG